MTKCALIALSVALVLSVLTCVNASSHSEAPGTAGNPGADVTDFYMFRSYEAGREDFVTFIMNIKPLQDGFAGPNYHSLSDDHFYELYIDNNGDAREDITIQMYYGNRMGGEEVDVPFEPDEDDCIIGDLSRAKRNWNPNLKDITIKKHGGVTIDVGGKQIPIPLKVFGTVNCNGNTCDTSRALNWFEWYQINVIRGDRTHGTKQQATKTNGGGLQFEKPFDYAGTKSFPDYNTYWRQYIHDITIPGCPRPGKVFLGQRKEPFYIKLGPIFDLINFIPIPNFNGAVQENNAVNNDLRDKNVASLVLEIPISCVTSTSTDVIGAWTGVRKLHHAADEHVPGKQVSRLGQPLVNELFIGLRDKDKFNGAVPLDDGQFLEYVQYPTLPTIIDLLFRGAVAPGSSTSLAPNYYPRNDLVTTFLTGIKGLNQPPNVVASEMMRLNVSISPVPASAQKNFGVIASDAAGFPNGRRPGDDVVDIALRVVMGRLCIVGGFGCDKSQAPVGEVDFTDGAPVNAGEFFDTFPYLKPPTPGAQ